MKRTLLSLAALAAVAAAPNWTSRISETAEGAYVMGNPAAKVRLVEYLSYTCSHCAEFVGEAKGPLKAGYVARGTVSVEVRNAVRDRFDFAASLLARCGGPAKFFGNTEAIMAAQPQWLGKAGPFSDANAEKLNTMPIAEGLKLIARGTGLDAIMKTRGLSAAQIDACLIDKAAQAKVIGMTNEAWNTRKITGTPSFLINTTLLRGAGHWAQVEPELKAALAAK